MDIFRNLNHTPNTKKSKEGSLIVNSPKSSSQISSCLSPTNNIKIRESSLKKTSKNFFIVNETQKIEEDFRIGLTQLNLNSLLSKNSKSVKAEEVKLYEHAIENGLLYVQLLEKKLGSFLFRTWKSFRKLSFEVEEPCNKQFLDKTTATQVICKEKHSQTYDENEEIDDQNLDVYIEHLNRAMLRADAMNHDKLVSTLKKLLSDLGENDDLGLEGSGSYDDDINAIFIRNVEIASKPVIRVKTELKQEKLKMPPLMTEKTTQTIEKNDDEISRQYLIKLLVEKENKIFSLNNEVKRLFNIEKDYNKIKFELKICREAIQEILKSNCSNCKEKVSQFSFGGNRMSTFKQMHEQEMSEIETLKKLNLSSKAEIENQLKAINELNESVYSLNRKIDEIKKKKKLLKMKLIEEEKLRREAESKYKDLSIERHNSLRTPSISKKDSIFLSQTTKNQVSMLEKRKSLNQRTQKTNLKRNMGTINSESSSISDVEDIDMNHSQISKALEPTLTKNPKIRIIRKMFEEVDDTRPKSSSSMHSRKRDILKILKISKEEFSSMSKQIRSELFECLFEHKSKCGPDCEHLRRAAQIRLKLRKTPYPMKKYNL